MIRLKKIVVFTVMRSIGFIFILFLISSCVKEDRNIYTIETNYGDIKIRLYDETPLHRDNFQKLVRENFYDEVLFHRVVNHFVIQAGDPASRKARTGVLLGAQDAGREIDAEIRPAFFHRRGVVAAARESDNINPERKSSGSHFYIVLGNIYTPSQLDSMVVEINDKRRQDLFKRLKEKREIAIQVYESKKDFGGLEQIHKELSEETTRLFEKEKLVLSTEQKKAYTTTGGIPRLDGAYTVFGEVIEGMNIVDRIAELRTDGNDRPLEDVIILKVKW